VHNAFVFGHLAQQFDIQDSLDIAHREHLSTLNEAWFDPIENESNIRDLGGFQESYDPVSIAHCRNFRVGHYDRFVGTGNGVLETHLNTGGAVENDVVELTLKLFAEFLHLLRLNGVFLTALRRGKNVEILKSLVLDHRLAKAATLAFDNVDQVEDDAILES